MSRLCLLVPLFLLPALAAAHDPIFGLGPHVLFKRGIEVSASHAAEQRNGRTSEQNLELTWGMTGDWAVGMEVSPTRGIGRKQTHWFSKYRFWRRDSLGVQQSAAFLLRRENDAAGPAWVSGLAWGHESRRHYRWASIRYRKADNGRDPSMQSLKLDLVAGYRPWLTGYLQPDTVLMLELNMEKRLNAPAGESQSMPRWFLSPGIFWTRRNFAIKAGVQIPVRQDTKPESIPIDYRALMVLEWHY